MPEYVIVRINQRLLPEFQTNYNSKDNITSQKVISSWTQIELQKNEKLILIIAANLVFNSQVKIPSKSDEVIRQSLPYTMEEELCNDIEQNHFAYSQLSDQNFNVAIVGLDIIQEIRKQIDLVGLNCDTLYSEIYSIPEHKNATTLFILKKYIIVRDGSTGTTLTKKLLAPYLKLSDKNKHVIYAADKLKLPANKKIVFNIADTLQLQAQTISSVATFDNAVNLFQGDYAQNIDIKKTTNPWKKVKILLTLLVFSWLFINIFQLWQLSSEIDSAKTHQSDLLRKLIPNASQSELLDPYSAIQSRLKISQTELTSTTSAGFIKALGYLGQTLAQNPDVQIQSLRLRNSKLEVKVKTSSLSYLNKFQSNLERNVIAMRIKTGTRDTDKDGINSIITMEQL